MIDARAQAADVDPGKQLARLAELGLPAVASFTAAVAAEEGLEAARIEHHAALSKNALAAIAGEAERRWGLGGVILVHRHGRLAPGARIAFAAVAAGSHNAALEACAWLAEALATRAPFWRKDHFADGSARWR